jgi:peptidoglycan/LPS O-acetylase OafA/YrhL
MNIVRYHGLDFLRAFMMILGVVLHVGVMYMPEPYGNDIASILNDPKDPYRDIGAYSITIQRIVFVIHYFRMPAFMLLAGFFAALLLNKRGVKELIKNRLIRIAVPAILFWFVLWPMDSFGWALGERMILDQANQYTLNNHISNNFSWHHLPFASDRAYHTMHLWFIYYLILFYITIIAFRVLGNCLSHNLRSCLKDITETLFKSKYKYILYPVLVSASFLTLKLGSTFHFMGSFRFVPDIVVFVNYFVFFLTGWVAYSYADVICYFKEKAWLYSWISFFLVVALLWTSEKYIESGNLLSAGNSSGGNSTGDSFYFNLATLLQALSAWFMIFAFVGLAEKYISKPNPILTYMVGASYWIYLIHRPFCFTFTACLQRWDSPGLIKFFIVNSFVLLICLSTYHYLVRRTWIGWLLNGSKY